LHPAGAAHTKARAAPTGRRRSRPHLALPLARVATLADLPWKLVGLDGAPPDLLAGQPLTRRRSPGPSAAVSAPEALAACDRPLPSRRAAGRCGDTHRRRQALSSVERSRAPNWRPITGSEWSVSSRSPSQQLAWPRHVAVYLAYALPPVAAALADGPLDRSLVGAHRPIAAAPKLPLFPTVTSAAPA
jgi:hypothetical protein